jgi:hypothetical protein
MKIYVYRSSLGGYAGAATAKLRNGLEVTIAPSSNRRKRYTKAQITKLLNEAVVVAKEGALV